MKKFSIEENGYNKDEVHQFVNDVITNTSGIIEKCKLQKQEIIKLKKVIEDYRKVEDALYNRMIEIEKSNQVIRDSALKEAEVIIDEARNNASKIVNEALLKASEEYQKVERLERNTRIFKRKLQILVKEQQAIVDEIEVLGLE